MYDENIAWSTIVSSKQQMAKGVLGQDIKPDDPLLDKLVRMNDVSKELEELRGYGLNTGNQKVKK